MQLQVDDDVVIKKEVFESKLKALDDVVTKQSQNEDNKFRLLKDQLIKIQDTVQQEKILRDTQDEKARTKDIKSIESSLLRELASDK